MKTIFKSLLAITVVSLVLSSCGNGGSSKKGALSSSAAEKVMLLQVNTMNSMHLYQEDLVVN